MRLVAMTPIPSRNPPMAITNRARGLLGWLLRNTYSNLFDELPEFFP
jgi:hypothetical protein